MIKAKDKKKDNRKNGKQLVQNMSDNERTLYDNVQLR